MLNDAVDCFSVLFLLSSAVIMTYKIMLLQARLDTGAEWGLVEEDLASG